MSIPTGPWDIPLKEYVKVHSLMILITELKTDKVIGTYKVNYSEPEERRWIGRVSYWATTNGYSVETLSEEDYNKYVKDQ